MMFGSWRKCAKAIHSTSMAVGSKEVSGVTTDDQQLSHNSCRHQNKINAQATEIATRRSELNHTLDENQKLKEMFNPDQLAEAMTKVVSNMTMKESPKHLRALNKKALPIMLSGQGSPNWHVVLMGNLSQMCPATFTKTKGTQKTTESALIIK